MKIIESIQTKNRCYTAGRKITVKGLMLHSVGCPQPNATVFVKNWNNTSASVCVHGFIDANDGTIYQTLPWNHRGWHAGASANNTHIGVEMCEPDCIKYTSGDRFTCSNFAKAKEMAKRTYEVAVELFAMLCKEYNLDPLADGVIISHNEGRLRGVASGHTDPEHLWTQLKTGYTMNGFRQAVKAAMEGDSAGNETAPGNSESTLYRVQVGAYGVKKNAEAQLAKIKAAGFSDAFIAVVDGKLYRVQVGAFSVKANAEAQLAKLKKMGFDGFVTKLGGDTITDKPIKKSVDEIAREVISGKWGNGTDRKKRLTAAGYDYKAVQEAVNQKLEESKKQYYTVQRGDTLS